MGHDLGACDSCTVTSPKMKVNKHAVEGNGRAEGKPPGSKGIP